MGNDSGLLFRVPESGASYQITLDYLQGGSIGRLIGEGGIECNCGGSQRWQPGGMWRWRRIAVREVPRR